jgi:hypothetical protein
VSVSQVVSKCHRVRVARGTGFTSFYPYPQIHFFLMVLFCKASRPDSRSEIPTELENGLDGLGIKSFKCPKQNNIRVRLATALIRLCMISAIGISDAKHSYSPICIAYLGNVPDERKGTEYGKRWILDSGASRHFCNDITKFKSLRTYGTARFVKVANGKHIRIRGFGECVVHMRDTMGRDCEIVLKDVAFVPEFSDNLISVKRLWKDNRIKTKFGERDYLKLLDGRKIGFESCESLYTITAHQAADTEPLPANLIHARLGHCHWNKIRKAAERSLGLQLPEKTTFAPCEACAKGGAKKHPFSAADTNYTHFGQVISSDLVGPFPTSANGYNYAICFVDRYTHYCAIYFLKSKSGEEVLSALKRFQSKYSSYLPGGRIERWHTDNGGEFMTSSITEFCEEIAVRRTFSVPYAPPQNAQAERIWGILLRKMRIMHAASKLHDRHWTFSMRHACKLHNILPSASLSGEISPYECLTQRLPDFSKLRVFGCKCFVLLPEKDRTSKISPRAAEAIHLGNDNERNGYFVYIPSLDRFTTSYHITFHEESFCESNSWDGPEPGKTAVPPKLCGTKGCTFAEHGDSPHSFELFSEGGEPEISTELRSEPVRHYDYRGMDEDAILAQFLSAEEFSKSELFSKYLKSFVAVEDTATKRIICFKATSGGPIPVPKTYEEAMASPWAVKWKEAMQNEITALMENGTWDEIKLSDMKSASNVTKSKWVFDIKYNRDGTINKFKARFVVCGYSQIQGLDYDRSFSATLKATSFRLLLALAVKSNLAVEHIDISNAFTQAHIDDVDIYVTPPKGFETTGKVLKLKRALYGTMQAGRLFQLELRKRLISMGFTPCVSDPCMYVCNTPNGKLIIGAYVDDLIVCHDNPKIFNKFMDRFLDPKQGGFKGKHLGTLDWFLGIGVDVSKGCIRISQKSYISNLMQRFLPTKTHHSHSTPCTSDAIAALGAPKSDEERERMKSIPYLQIVGSLLYISTMTRPDINFVMSKLCMHMADPNLKCYELALNVLLYLDKTKDMVIQFTSNPGTFDGLHDHKQFISHNLDFVTFSDASWGDACPVYGYCCFMSDGPIAFCAKKLKSAGSSCEAEYTAAYFASKEIEFIRNLLDELGSPFQGSVIIAVDNTAAIDVANDYGVSAKTKHFERATHYLREMVTHLKVKLVHVRSMNQLADIFTKALGKTDFQRIRGKFLVVSAV